MTCTIVEESRFHYFQWHTLIVLLFLYQSLLSFWLQSQFLVPRYLSQTVLCGHWKLWEVLEAQDGRCMSKGHMQTGELREQHLLLGLLVMKNILSFSTSSVHARLGNCCFHFFINVSVINWAEENVCLSTKLTVNETHPPAGDCTDDLQADDKTFAFLKV